MFDERHEAKNEMLDGLRRFADLVLEAQKNDPVFSEKVVRLLIEAGVVEASQRLIAAHEAVRG